jgi:hypothetical protein
MQHAPARKYERVRLLVFDHGKLEVAVEGRSFDGLPHSIYLPSISPAES